MKCTVCNATAFKHHGYAGWLCHGCAERGLEAYELAIEKESAA